jgi:WD40-like Beta Propeller Repeat
LPDGKSFLFTSIRSGDQADLYRHNLQDHRDTQITNTPESEFSPTLMPDSQSISTVRVEADQTQRLWMFPLQGGSSQLVLKDIKPVGYHVWIDSKTLGLFILGDPDTLQIADIQTGTARTVASKIGRCMKKIPGTGQISFVNKESEKKWIIERYDPKTGQIMPILETLAGAEDYAWTSTGLLLMAQDTKLYFADLEKGSTWTQFADLSSTGAKNITRIDITPKNDKIAFVAQ